MERPLKFGNGQVISSHTLLDMWLLIHADIKVKQYWCKGPWYMYFVRFVDTAQGCQVLLNFNIM